MDITQLLEPVLTHGIRSTNFFNGRVLTAQDLRAEQEANRDHDRQLALALGEGVVHGLEVTRAEPQEGVPVVRIEPGLGLNRDGDPVRLGRAVDLKLVTKETEVSPEAGLFAVCTVPERRIELTNVGLYVLTVRPASALSEERAPMTELGSQGVAEACGSRWALEGVRFAVAPLPLAPAGETPTPLASQLATLATQVESDVDLVRRGGASETSEVSERLARRLSRLRNGAAHLCFGTDSAAQRLADPLPAGVIGLPDPRYGALDTMREREELASCELPLALFYLSKRGVEWIDNWAVRRPLVPVSTAGSLAVLPAARSSAEGVAMLLQFQQHMKELVTSGLGATQLSLVEAVQRFLFLPPVGLLPLREGGRGRGFDHQVFFGRQALGSPTPLSSTKLGRVVAHALLHAPVKVSGGGSVQLWRVLQNPHTGASPVPYIVFVTRQTAGPLWRDDIAATLEAAWSTWRGVIRRRLFLPPGTDADKVAAQVSIVNAVRDVMDIAARGAASARAGALDDDGAVAEFRRLYDVQNDVQVLFRSAIPGIVHSQGRDVFGEGLNQRLNVSAPGGGLALRPALDAGDLLAAVEAQASINQFIAGWSGEGVAVGPIVLDYRASPLGNELVPGDTDGFPHIFRLRNGTDRTLTIALEGTATAPSGDWSEAVQVEDVHGAPLQEIRLASGGVTDLVARVLPPAEAVIGETVELRLRVRVEAPNDRDVTATRSLTVAGTPGTPVSGSVEVIRPDTLPFDLDDAPPGVVGNFSFHLRFTGLETLPSTADFEVVARIESTQPELWVGEFGDRATEDRGGGVYATDITLTRNEPSLLEFLLVTPPRGGTDRAATLRLQVKSTDLAEEIEGELDPPLEMRVRSS